VENLIATALDHNHERPQKADDESAEFFDKSSVRFAASAPGLDQVALYV